MSGTLDHVASLALQITLLLVLSSFGSLDYLNADSGALNLLLQVVNMTFSEDSWDNSTGN